MRQFATPYWTCWSIRETGHGKDAATALNDPEMTEMVEERCQDKNLMQSTLKWLREEHPSISWGLYEINYGGEWQILWMRLLRAEEELT